MDDVHALVNEIQGIKQKMVEAAHLQRQYRNMADVIMTESIGHQSALHDMEKAVDDAKCQALKLKVIELN